MTQEQKLIRAQVGMLELAKQLGNDSHDAGLYTWLEIECSRCKSRRGVDLAALRHPPTTFVHDLASRLRCSKCAKAGRRPSATLLQLTPRPRQAAPET